MDERRLLRALNAPHAITKNVVTFARHCCETLRVDDADLTAADLDKTGTLKKTDGYGYACPSRAEQAGNHVVGQKKNIAANGVARDQKPSANAFLQRVVTVADTRLGDLNQKGIGVFQEQVAKKRVAPEFFI